MAEHRATYQLYFYPGYKVLKERVSINTQASDGEGEKGLSVLRFMRKGTHIKVILNVVMDTEEGMEQIVDAYAEGMAFMEDNNHVPIIPHKYQE